MSEDPHWKNYVALGKDVNYRTTQGRQSIMQARIFGTDVPESSPDGLSFYRALARQSIGDPREHRHIRNAVLEHYIRSLVQACQAGTGNQNALQSLYEAYDRAEWGQEDPPRSFFERLCLPDFALCRCQDGALSKAVLQVITNALEIRVVVWQGKDISYQQGPVCSPEYHVMLRGSQEGNGCDHRFDSLIEDHSGRCLIEYLLDRQSLNEHMPNGLNIKKVIWYQDPSGSSRTWYLNHSGYACYNENRNERGPPPPLQFKRYSLTIFTVSVSRPDDIQGAIDLLENALERAPAQELPNFRRGETHSNILKRYVSIDAEFKKVDYEDEVFERLTHKKSEEYKKSVEEGRTEELCSVLTIAIDRHLVFSFYILSMLQDEKANEHTVEKLSTLFRKVVFNDQVIKLWFHYQQDIKVLNDTIAHMFQLTPRSPYTKRKYIFDGSVFVRVQPTWKFSNEAFNGSRPQDLEFPHGQAHCELHGIQGNSSGVNETGLSCPCRQTSNVDITTILDNIAKQLGLRHHPDDLDEGPSDNITRQSRAWTTLPGRCNYATFLFWMFRHDRLGKLLTMFKDAPKRYEGYYDGERHEFYQDLGPGLERDNEAIGYNAGDVIGIALTMRFLTTSDNRKLFLQKIIDYGTRGARFWSDDDDWDDHLFSSLEFSSSQQIPQIEDYPKRWRREYIGNVDIRNWYMDSTGSVEVPEAVRKHREGRYWKAAEHFKMREQRRTRDLTYYEHQHRALAEREACDEAWDNPDSENHRVLNASHMHRTQNIFHRKTFDPLDFELPEFMTRAPDAVNSPYADYKRSTVVPAYTTPLENLYGMIVDSFTALDSERAPHPPRGFGIPNQSGYQPGDSMVLDGKNLTIKDAYKAREKIVTQSDLESDTLDELVHDHMEEEAKKLYGNLEKWKEPKAGKKKRKYSDFRQWKRGDKLVGKSHNKNLVTDPTGEEYEANLALGPLW